MAVINLIEQEQNYRRTLERKARMVGFGWFGVVALAGLAWAGSMLYIGLLARELDRTQQEIQKLQPAVKQLQQARAELGALQPMVTTLKDARKETGRWRQLFQHLSLQMPEGSYLTNAELGKRTNPEQPLEVVLRGISRNQENVGLVMLRLNQHPELEAVRLDYTQERTMADGPPVYEFQIAAQVKGTAVVKKKEEKSSGS
ncbi:MAG: PilN domain-containing protein [Fimbriimonadales bacterium]